MRNCAGDPAPRRGVSREREDPRFLSRRALLRGTAGVGLTVAAAAYLPACGSGAKSGSGRRGITDGPPETTTIRLNRTPLSCSAAPAVALDFLRQEGFTDVRYLDIGLRDQFTQLATGGFDIHLYPAPLAAARVDAGDPIVMLAGVHVGCWQLFGTDAIKSVRDFAGKTVSTGGPGTPDDVFLAVTLANVGIDVRKDVKVVTHSPAEAAQVLAAGQVAGVTALPPFSQQLRARGIGHVVVDSMMDRPWSQYFCCMATVNRTFMVKNPVATKRALRALLKASDVVAKDPERGVSAMVDLGFTGAENYDATLQDLRMIPYDVWRQYDPADTLRFYALRLREAGLVKSTPEQIIARGTDFGFLRELKQELKEG
jgi:NitT/TauT family transport system substrate-binding protein